MVFPPKNGKKKIVDVNSLIDDGDVMVDVNELIDNSEKKSPSKNGSGNGTNGLPQSTSQLPLQGGSASHLLSDPREVFSFDKFSEFHKPEDNPTPLIKPINPKYPIRRTYKGQELGFKSEDEANAYEQNNGVVSDKPKPVTLLEATQQDKELKGNRFSYLMNELGTGITSTIAGANDLLFQGVVNVLPKSVVGSTDENAIKQFREQTNPQIKSTLNKALTDDISPELQEKYGNEFLTSSVGGLLHSASAIATPKGARVAALLFQGYDAAGDMIENSEEGQKLPENFKTGFRVTVGMAQAALEETGLNIIFGRLSSKVAKNLAVRTLADLTKKADAHITTAVFNEALVAASKTMKKRIIGAGGKISQAGLVEFTTGSLQEASTILLEQAANKIADKEVFADQSWIEGAKRILYSGAQEAVGGVILGGVAVPMSKTRNYISEKVAAAKTTEEIENLKSELITVSENQNLSDGEKEQVSKTIDDYVRVNKKIPSDIEQSRKELSEKIIEREEIQNQVTKKLEEVTSVDDAFKPMVRDEMEALKNRSEEINDEIKELSGIEADTKLSVPIEGLDEQGVPIEENISQPTELTTEVSNAPLIDNLKKVVLPFEIKYQDVEFDDPLSGKIEKMSAQRARGVLEKRYDIIDNIVNCLT